jgi:competence protein ComEC
LIWRTAWRWFGFLPILVGLLLIMTRPAADLLISADGKQVAARVVGDQYALLRFRRGSFSSDMMLEAAGSERQAIAIKDWPSAQCNEDFCRWTMEGDGRTYQILASRSSRLADYDALIAACHQADIVISDRNMPRACRPFMLMDRDQLAASGGAILHLANQPIWLSRPSDQSDHPWRNAELVSGNDER